jgi:hypothetical protein
MGLRRAVMLGTIKDQTVGGQTIEIWSCTFHLSTDANAAPLAVAAALVAPIVSDYFQDADTGIGSTVQLDSLKFNDWDPVTNKQINPVTVEVPYLGNLRGAVGGAYPTFQSVRVSLDDGGRVRYAKGGFFLPRYQGEIGLNGRYTAPAIAALAGSTQEFINALNNVPGHVLSVYSPTSGGTTTVTRLRLGDVPDYISRRKSAMAENYQTFQITP